MVLYDNFHHPPLFTAGDLAPPVMLLLIAIDRLFAIAKPIFYKTKPRHAVAVSVAGLLVILFYPGMGAVSSYLLPRVENQSILCMSENSYAPWFPRVLHGTVMLLSWLGLAVYLTIFIKVRIARYNSRGNSRTTENKEKSINRTIFLIALCTAVFHTFPMTFYWLLFFVAGDDVADQYGQPIGILAAANGGINILIYIWRNKDLREAILKLCGMRAALSLFSSTHHTRSAAVTASPNGRAATLAWQ